MIKAPISKFKIGQKVRLKDGRGMKSPIGWVSPFMDKIIGNVFTISGIDKTENRCEIYILKNVSYYYAGDWLESVVIEPMPLQKYVMINKEGDVLGWAKDKRQLMTVMKKNPEFYKIYQLSEVKTTIRLEEI